AAEVFITDIDAADDREAAIHHRDLAMIAEVDLEAVAPALGGVERADIDAGFGQGADIGARQLEAADLVVEEVDLDAGARLGLQSLAQALADTVVAHDVVLEQDVFLRLFDRVEQR